MHPLRPVGSHVTPNKWCAGAPYRPSLVDSVSLNEVLWSAALLCGFFVRHMYSFDSKSLTLCFGWTGRKGWGVASMAEKGW